MRLLPTLLSVLATLSACGTAAAPDRAEPLSADEPLRADEPVVGLPCEGCEAVFDGLPDQLEWSTRIAPPGEPGEPLTIEGTVRDGMGRPTDGVIVYAYQTDARGLYPRAASRPDAAVHRHGRLRGWARSDPGGRFRFSTVRPGGYPDADLPAHVHLHVLEVGRCTYYIDDLLFDDDPRLTEAKRRELIAGRGGSGLASPSRAADGAWRVRRDIVLGERIPGYPARASSSRD